MRPECLECVAKHLADAQINLDETLMGYPKFIHKVMGNMNQASSECLRYDLPFANEIREIRLKLWEGWWLYRTGEIGWKKFSDDYAPDIDTLLDRVDDMILCQMLTEKPG